MDYRDEEERAFYDACYENWRRGGSRGMDLDGDDYDDFLARGHDPDESADLLLQQEAQRERRQRRQ